MAGGPQIPEEEILKNVEGCIKAGGVGVAIGRNSFHHEDTTKFVKKVYEIVHGKD